jgi:hypothetical protein
MNPDSPLLAWLGGFVLLVIVVVVPTLLILSLNTLVPALAIPYTFETWCAAFYICLLFVAANLWTRK